MSTALMNDDYSNPSSLQYPSPSPTPSPKNSMETYPNTDSSDEHVHDPIYDSKPSSSAKLDISGDFPYFEPDDEDEEKFIANLDPDKDLTQHQTEKLEEYTLRKHGYVRTSFIAKTLQGQVFNATLSKYGKSENVVIKKTSKKLHKLGITITKKGKKVSIQEDIVTEAKVLKSFHANSPPASLIGLYGFFEDSHFYYLCMERGGTDYFDFIVNCHDMIIKKQLSLNEWRKQCKFMFAQMVQFVQWMHSKMHCAHLDISLENILIRPTSRYDADTQTLQSCYIKFIDFGLTEFFDLSQNPSWKSQKFVGKTHYKAPKVYAKQEEFCANKADIWSLGVCLFMMVVGAPPYNKPVDRDVTFQYVKYGQIAKLLQEWQRINYVTANLHDLLTRMLCFDESQRITMDELVKHPWIKHYFPEQNEEKIIESSCNDKLENTIPSQSSTTIVSSPPLEDDDDHNKENYESANIQPPRTSISVSQSQSMHISPTSLKISNVSKQSGTALGKVNVMTAQQCVSMSSVSSFSSQHRTPSSVRRRYTSPYQSPRSPISPSPSVGITVASPIIQSHTSTSDHVSFCASIENDKKNETKHEKVESQSTDEQQTKKKKKKSKSKSSKFFKLFGGGR